MQKIPYISVIGAKEAVASLIAVRKRGEGDVGTKKLGEFLENIKKEIAKKQ